MTVMTPLSSGVQPRARAQSAGGRPCLGVGRSGCRGAPRRLTLHSRGSTKRSPAHLRMMMSETPPPPSPSAGARSARCTERLEQRKAHDVFDIPTIPRRQTCATGGAHVAIWALGRAAPGPTPLVPSAQREAATGLPYRRPGPRRCTPSRRRARSARRRWQPAAAPPGTQARSALGAQRRAPSAERVARGGDQVRRRRRARSAHATGAERVARGGASWHAGAARASSRSSNAGRLLPASATLTLFVGGFKTMSPAPGRRPPIHHSERCGEGRRA